MVYQVRNVAVNVLDSQCSAKARSASLHCSAYQVWTVLYALQCAIGAIRIVAAVRDRGTSTILVQGYQHLLGDFFYQMFDSRCIVAHLERLPFLKIALLNSHNLIHTVRMSPAAKVGCEPNFDDLTGQVVADKACT